MTLNRLVFVSQFPMKSKEVIILSIFCRIYKLMILSTVRHTRRTMKTVRLLEYFTDANRVCQKKYTYAIRLSTSIAFFFFFGGQFGCSFYTFTILYIFGALHIKSSPFSLSNSKISVAPPY